jgi:hydrogenase nickel incorporation protein HypA/HybF
MHELAITQEIVDSVVQRVAERGGHRVTRLVLEIGKLSAVLPSAVEFCFELCAEDTPLAGASLVILQPPGVARCATCGQKLELEQPYGLCGCGSSELQFISGDELRIREMEML